jgi:hypothetical protein
MACIINTPLSQIDPNTHGHRKERIRKISISQLDRGYVVHVGCQEFAISTTAELVSRLREYINDPARIESMYEEGKLF